MVHGDPILLVRVALYCHVDSSNALVSKLQGVRIEIREIA